MRRERGQQHEPPQTGWCEQKRCNHDRIRRPKNGYWMRLKRECKTDFAPKIVSSEHPQPDHQQMPVKNCANSVRVPCGRLNVRGFKRDGSTFHQSEKSFFRKMRWRRYCRCDHRRNGAHHPRNARPCVPTPFYIPDHTWPPSRAEASFYVSPTSVALCQGGDSNPYGFLHQILR